MSLRKTVFKKIRKMKNFPYLSKNPAELEYVLGYTGSNGYLLVIDSRNFYFLTDGRYYESYKKHYPESIVLLEAGQSYDQIFEILSREEQKSVYFNPDFFSYSEILSLRKAIAPIKMKSDEKSLFPIRRLKNVIEIQVIKEGIALAEEGLAYIMASMKEGMSEKELAVELEYYLKLKGADALSFPSIVLFGERTAFPHGEPGDRKLCKEDVVLIDMGIKWKHFCTDMTRTFIFGEKGPEGFEEDYNFLLKIQNEAIEEIQEGMFGADLDKSLRDKLSEKDLLDYYPHSLGHGVGVEVHESPVLSHFRKKEKLSKGNLFTIEPGVYIPEKYGIRIEDMVYIHKSGRVEVLTSFPKELLKINH